jgi:antitoxin CcdA
MMWAPALSAKRPTNLTLNGRVIDMARELSVNIPQAVEALPTEEVQSRYWARWNE